ncbi:hypothetical protein GBAR_LOCUS6421 [Geodia barretti]|uniref:Uncharacterized protein n=1 Tax=Geodia barretti TaxID=519541 RepID=A0AA35RDS7_GEOBA|nr:hypothetical protein GBAR_LOCUS6421 [Geodia barretti]
MSFWCSCHEHSSEVLRCFVIHWQTHIMSILLSPPFFFLLSFFFLLLTPSPSPHTHTHTHTVAAVNNGTTFNLSQVTTVLLIQIDSAITTTHHFLTSEVLEKFDGVKTRMDVCERILYVNVAKVVKWADFDSRSPPMSSTASGKLVRNWIQEFETALGELVKLVEDTQMQLSGSSGTFSDTVQRQRRSSLGSSNSTGALGPLEPASLPQISTLKVEGGGRDRKISLPIVSTQPIARGLPAGMGKPPTGRESLGSMLSESSTSDEEKRRSGSTDRVSPDRHDLTMSGEWNGRNRSQTDTFAAPPIPIPAPRHPHPITSPSHTLTAPPAGALTDMDRSLLPPLPGEPHATGWRTAAGYPHDRRGHTMPRGASESPKVNGRWSPEPRLPGHHGSALGHGDDMPPPLPVKQKKRVNQQVNGQPPRPPIRRENYDDVPPPLPMKQRKGVGTTSPPTSTPGPSPSHSSSSEGDRPPMVPVRLDSIIPRGALHNEAAPPKPPRSDRPASMDQLPQPTSNEVVSAIRAVRRYNEDLMKGQAETGGEEKAPPIPLKKKTVMLYKEIVKGYHFDDTLMQPLYIPMAECGPPALPPKKRKSRRQVPSVRRRRDVSSTRESVDQKELSDDQRSFCGLSVWDLADDYRCSEDIN